ncbi:MAG: UvrD-helicase domain-containing protein [Candidatus Saccharimonadaceae bacterium]
MKLWKKSAFPNTFSMPLHNNKLIISVAGSGKTTFLVNEAIKVKGGQVLITTYTEANEQEIKNKFMQLYKCVPAHVTIQSWFSLLIKHGVKPFQGQIFPEKINGMILVNGQSGIKYTNKAGINVPFSEETDFKKHYMTSGNKLFSDKLSKFVVRANDKSNGNVINRLSNIYTEIYIDEVQDLAGNDLEFIKLLLKSKARVLMVGDPRQVTYLTHNERKYSQYKDGNIKGFILEKCKSRCTVDEETLTFSHRNNLPICEFSSRLYPRYSVSTPCSCPDCRNVSADHIGVFLVNSNDLENYTSKFRPTVLRYQLSGENEWNYGACKGLGFDRVLIYPTEPILKYLRDGVLEQVVEEKNKKAFDIAKLYVAVTRARYSVAFVCEDTSGNFIHGITKWSFLNNKNPTLFENY